MRSARPNALLVRYWDVRKNVQLGSQLVTQTEVFVVNVSAQGRVVMSH